MSTVLDKVILNIYGIKLAQLYNNSPRVIWEKHEEHQTSSSSSQQIAIVLKNRISNMNISMAKSMTVFLEEFDRSIIKFDKVSADKMPKSQKIGLLCKAANADIQLLQAWSSVETIIANGSTSGTAIP